MLIRTMSESAAPSLPSIALGGGCFWCLEAALRQLEGVNEVISGYCGGHVPDLLGLVREPSVICSSTTPGSRRT